jgi:signal transduction histidine kinase/CheY-like chemotaxis protein
MPLMDGVGGVDRFRRTYNQWVANETLEDFALRFTARRARRWSYGRVANTAIGSISFLALEAIGAAVTLSYGFDNAVAAILTVGALMFLTGLPICFHAARAGVDIDLLTRGAGFGYLGSTFTSLIYASFTFIFFALEAAILSQALELCFGVPLGLGYLLNALIVIPLVTHGFTRIGAFQKYTQPLWLALHLIPFAVLIHQGVELGPWLDHDGRLGGGGIDPVLFAAASGVVFSLFAQIGEQVDFLRFLPEPKTRTERLKWWAALISAGPGWAVIGTLKMLAGSFLAVMILEAGTPAAEAVEPTKMYLAAFQRFAAPEMALFLTGIFVVLSQLKINVTNAYAGSIAWSNFFSRLTHSHPGRVVWLVFNVAIALMLMEFGVFGALEHTLKLYGHVAVAWIGALTADLVVNRPLGLRPARITFHRGRLHDINPVGVGAMALATVASLTAELGLFGATAQAFSSFMALGLAFCAAPAIAVATRGRFYLARPTDAAPEAGACIICEHSFDPEDMIACPFHAGPICSLCCSLEARCGDVCRPGAAIGAQGAAFADRSLPESLATFARSRYGLFAAVGGVFTVIVAAILLLIREQAALADPGAAEAVSRALLLAFGFMVVVIGVAAWLHALAHESRVIATRERERQTSRLMAEIRAHERTDAALQRAKEAAEAASQAKSRYIVGISHELRSPLNAIMGYAQLLEGDPGMPERRRPALAVIRRSSEHLADLIEGLLDISKIEAGRLELHRGETRLREMLEQMAAIFEMEARDKGLGFAFEMGRETPERVHADERRLRQILMNLLSNAVRYTDRGDVRFAVRYRNDIAVFSVTDTGRGVAEADRERIFMPFERVVDPAAPVRGTGLGLTITRLLTEIQGGELTLDSRPGQGSTFRVRLMLPRLVDGPAPEPRRRIYGYRGPRRRILIVDDNAEHRALLEDALRPLGFALSFAESAEAALAGLEAAPPDLCLLDVAMPGMSGWTLAAVLRRERGLSAPIVMISAHAENPGGDPDAVAHHDDFLAKPVNIEALLGRIERHLRLEWLLERPRVARPTPPRAPEADLAAVERMTSIAHVRGAAAALAAIDDADPAAAAFVAEGRRLLDALDIAGLAALIGAARAANRAGAGGAETGSGERAEQGEDAGAGALATDRNEGDRHGA